jgi:hypothetical protein
MKDGEQFTHPYEYASHPVEESSDESEALAGALGLSASEVPEVQQPIVLAPPSTLSDPPSVRLTDNALGQLTRNYGLSASEVSEVQQPIVPAPPSTLSDPPSVRLTDNALRQLTILQNSPDFRRTQPRSVEGLAFAELIPQLETESLARFGTIPSTALALLALDITRSFPDAQGPPPSRPTVAGALSCLQLGPAHSSEVFREMELVGRVHHSILFVSDDEDAESELDKKRLMLREHLSSLLGRTILFTASHDHATQFGDCPVCQESFQPGNQVRMQPCLHKFHDECLMESYHHAIESILTTRGSDITLKTYVEFKCKCPVCKLQLNTSDDRDQTSSNIGASNIGIPGTLKLTLTFTLTLTLTLKRSRSLSRSNSRSRSRSSSRSSSRSRSP